MKRRRLTLTDRQLTAFKSLRREFTCSLCGDIFDKPCSVACPESHVFCEDCIFAHLGQQSTCPTCNVYACPRDVSLLHSIKDLGDTFADLADIVDKVQLRANKASRLLDQSDSRRQVPEQAPVQEQQQIPAEEERQAHGYQDDPLQAAEQAVAGNGMALSSDVALSTSEAEVTASPSAGLPSHKVQCNEESTDRQASEKSANSPESALPRTPGASQHSLSLASMLDGIISTQDLNRSELLMNERRKSINELTAAVDAAAPPQLSAPPAEHRDAVARAALKADVLGDAPQVAISRWESAPGHMLPAGPVPHSQGQSSPAPREAVRHALNHRATSAATNAATRASASVGASSRASASSSASASASASVSAGTGANAGTGTTDSLLAMAHVQSGGSIGKRKPKRRWRRRCQRVFVGTMLSGEQNEKLREVVCKLNASGQERAQVRKQVDGQTTHIITSDDHTTLRCSRTMKYFLGVARGLWVVSARWLDACSKAGKWVSEEAFEIIGGIPDPPLGPTEIGGPRRSRLHHQGASFRLRAGKLLDGMRFRFVGDFKSVKMRKWDLKQLALVSGATLVQETQAPNIGDTDIMICPSKTPPDVVAQLTQDTGLPVVSHVWLLQCVTLHMAIDWNQPSWLLPRASTAAGAVSPA